MLKKPVKLFGNEYRQEDVRFVHVDGTGYWFLYRKSRLVGEREFLRDISKKSQQQIWSRSWLIVEIVNDNLEELKAELYAKNPQKLTDKELEETRTDEKVLRLALEELVRNSLGDVELLYHPVISKYRSQFTKVFLEDDSEYNNQIVISAFNNRLIVSDELIQKDSEDQEKGVLLADDIYSGKVKIGEKAIQADLTLLDEALLGAIYAFCISEFNNEEYKTSKDKEWDAAKAKQKEVDATADEEKKLDTPIPSALTPSAA